MEINFINFYKFMNKKLKTTIMKFEVEMNLL